MKRILILSILFLTVIQATFSQIEGEFRETFLEAESEFLFEEYSEAQPDYETLARQYPDNDNINYKLGVCLLNNPYQKEDAIGYLEKAAQNFSLKYKENSFKETRAPLEAFFYLGTAYRINNQLEKAIETYQTFKDQADPELYDLDLVDEQIQACRNAMELQTQPVDIDVQNLGDVVNTRFTESNFVVSADETALVYVQKLAFYDAPFFAEKVDGQWFYPRNLIASGEFGPGVDEDIYPVALSYEGDEMIIYRSDNFIGDLYSSTFVDGFWTPIQKLNDNINTKYWESSACFSAGGDTLYFTSNRKGTIGGLDIYYSIRDEEGEWGVPVNLGPTINTRYNEDTPVLTSDGKTLYFSSYGHHNMGGYDVFYSTRLEDGDWSVPINAGYPINTTDDDVHYVPVRNGSFAYYPRFQDGGFGLTDIYLVEIYSSTHPRKFQVSGILGIDDLKSLTHPLRVLVIEQFSRDTVAVAIADPETGEYNFEVPRGQYDILIEGEDIETSTFAFEIQDGYREKEMEITREVLLTQAKRLEDMLPRVVDNIIAEDTVIHVSNGDPVDIKLSLEKNARLFLETYHDSLHFKSDSFLIENPQYVYSYPPVPGENLLKFKMVDSINRLSFKDIYVIYTPSPEEPLVLIPEPIVPEPIEVEEQTMQLQSELLEMSSGSLQEMLGNLDMAGEGISTEEDLLIYLREHADEYNYDTQDVYDLIRKKMEVEYLQDYIDELIRITDDEKLLKALQEIDLTGENISTLQDLYEAILLQSDEYGYDEEKVNDMFSLLSQREELNTLIENLSSIATGDMQKVIREMDLDRESIRNPVEMMSYLLENASEYDYTEQEAMAVLLNYLGKKDLKEVVKTLISNSTGDLQTLLINLDLEANNIHSLSDLYEYLMVQANSYDFTETDVMRLFLKLLDAMENQPLVTEIEVPERHDEKPRRTGGTWPFYVLGGILLIIILLFIRRRKKPDRDQ